MKHTLSSLRSQDLFWLGCPLSNVHTGGLEAHRMPVKPDPMPKHLDKQILNLEDDSCRLFGSHQSRVQDEDKEPAKKGDGVLCNVTGTTKVNTVRE